MHFQHIITNVIGYWDRIAGVGDRWSSVASELEETGQRLLNTHAHTHTHTQLGLVCRDKHTCTYHCVVMGWALELLHSLNNKWCIS